MVVSGKQELITQAYSKGAVKPLTGGQEAVSSSLATRTILNHRNNSFGGFCFIKVIL